MYMYNDLLIVWFQHVAYMYNDSVELFISGTIIFLLLAAIIVYVVNLFIDPDMARWSETGPVIRVWPGD